MSEHDGYDMIIVGGGPAGLTAALYLGRSRQRVVVLDAGAPRHAVSSGVHNFLTRDGMPPAELREVAWQQMAAYPSVERGDGVHVVGMTREGGSLVVEGSDGGVWRAPSVLLALGMLDERPDIEGFEERWGGAIHQCPFCHGWEVRDRPLALLSGEHGTGHMAKLLGNWSEDVVVVTNGRALSLEDRAELDALGVPVREEPIAALEGEGEALESIRFEGGASVAREALFAMMPQRQVPLVVGLGVELDDQGYVQVDEEYRTSLPGIWAAGDMTTRGQQVIESASHGAKAAIFMLMASVFS